MALAVIGAFFDLADAIITVRRLIREAWTLDRRDGRRQGDHNHLPIRAVLPGPAPLQ